MYDIKQFRTAMYLLVLLGILGFTIAAESPVAMLLAGGMTILNGWLVKTGRFRPMPRWLASVLTILVALLIFSRLGASTPILLICEFLLALQIIKLFEQRANRDYAQLLVLSLLLMVASIINTSSLMFAIVFIAYMFLALYCCLLFHLKVETEHAKNLMGLNTRMANPMTLRQDQRSLPSSMRKLTAIVSVYAVTLGILVFLFFPRGAGAGMLGLQFKPPAAAETGYSEEVDFQRSSPIGQNEAVVAHVWVTRDGVPIRTGEIYLRGSTVDFYDSDANSASRWQWGKPNRLFSNEERRVRTGEALEFRGSADATNLPRYVQEIMLQPTGEPTLFAMPGLTSLVPQRDLALSFSMTDQSVKMLQPIVQPMKYQAVSTGISPPSRTRSSYSISKVDPRIQSLARDPKVSGLDTDGTPLVDKLRRGQFTEVNRKIAANFETYLQQNFKYSLDITSARKVDDNGDPMAGFLFDFKQGHCMYFASAMTLMCQSLQMPARYVSGFRTNEYNSLPGAGYFIARQSHAHAWVEVLTPEGWTTFDPTSGDEVDAAIGRKDGVWNRVKHALDFLQFTWANNVIAYDQGSRTNLIEKLGTTMDQTAVTTSGKLADYFKRNRDDGQPDSNGWIYSLTSMIIMALVSMMLLGAMIAIGVFIVQRARLKRRAKRIGLEGLDADLELQLARQLGFYDKLIGLLESRGAVRAAHLTPREFARQLSQLPADSYSAVNRLTEIYYKIRYGGQRLEPALQKRLERVVDRLEKAV